MKKQTEDRDPYMLGRAFALNLLTFAVNGEELLKKQAFQQCKTYYQYRYTKGLRDVYQELGEKEMATTRSQRTTRNVHQDDVAVEEQSPTRTKKKAKISFMKKVVLTGRLGKDPEYIGNGDKLLKSSLAVSFGVEDDDTVWYDVNLWLMDSDVAELEDQFSEYKKGELVTVTGTLTRREYKGKYYWGISLLSICLAEDYDRL